MLKVLKIMFIILVVIVGILLTAALPFFILTPRVPMAPSNIETVAKLETYFKALTFNETPPALDIVVMKGDTVVYSMAFGSPDGVSGKPAVPTCVYHYWSVTKLFTATAILQLAEGGKLSLDDFVTKYLPDFKTVGPLGAPVEITIRQLLDHTSGMKKLGPADLVGWIHHLDDPSVSQTTPFRKISLVTCFSN